MVLEKNDIEFLGQYVREGKIQLQPHISKKILDFSNEPEIPKELQSFLGLLNYARQCIKNLSSLICPLTSKLTKIANFTMKNTES